MFSSWGGLFGSFLDQSDCSAGDCLGRVRERPGAVNMQLGDEWALQGFH